MALLVTMPCSAESSRQSDSIVRFFQKSKTRERPFNLINGVQIIVAAVASPVLVDVVFGAGRFLVWSEAGIDTAARLLDRRQAPAEEVVDSPVGKVGEAADNRTGTAVAVDLLEARP